jgi:hypothetical protein
MLCLRIGLGRVNTIREYDFPARHWELTAKPTTTVQKVTLASNLVIILNTLTLPLLTCACIIAHILYNRFHDVRAKPLLR